MATTDTTAVTEAGQLRTIPLSRIVIPDGFNPRGPVAEDRECYRPR